MTRNNDGRHYYIKYSQKRAIVCFGDITGFGRWTKSLLFNNKNYKKRLIEIYRPFVDFTFNHPFFCKSIGDGIMIAAELNHNKSANGEKTFSVVKSCKELTASVNDALASMEFPRPDGFRIRLVAGDVVKVEIASKKKHVVDYLGHPVNLAFDLQQVQPELPFMAYETVKDLLIVKKNVRAVPIHLLVRHYKGVDSEVLKALYDFEW